MRRASTITSCLLFGLCLGACVERDDTTPQTGEHRWGELFAPYPGARKLCEQSVDGFSCGQRMGFTWAAFASTDDPEKVGAFYARNTSGATVEKSEHGLTQLRGPGHTLLSVMIAARGGYPTCGVKPASTDLTVIIVSY